MDTFENYSPGDSSDTPLYATFARRVNAISLDALILFGFTVLTFAMVPAVETIAILRVGIVILWWAVLLFYDPLLVWRFGGTFGHRLLNLRVVDDRTGGNVGFGKAIGRTFVKGLLGLFTFLSMSLSRRHRAIHDIVTSSSVQIRDPARARPHHYVTERTASLSPPAT